MGRGLEEASSWKSEVPFLEGNIKKIGVLDPGGVDPDPTFEKIQDHYPDQGKGCPKKTQTVNIFLNNFHIS